DGIRDFHVTGVQTCALPIFVPSYPTDARKAKGDAGLVAAGLLCGIKGYFENQLLLHLADRAEARHRMLPDPFVEFLEFGVGETRSEERRVGEEWRVRSGRTL